jgi:hypothetical protein
MFYVVEAKEQLDRLVPSKECFVKVILGNDSYHPLLSEVSLVYYRNETKGYILAVNHSEAFSINLSHIQDFLFKHEKVYCLDQKQTSHYLHHDNLIDINQIILDEENKLLTFECATKVHLDYYNRFPYLKNVNEIIPISKHYEKCECLYEQVKEFIGSEYSTEFYSEYCKQYQIVERQSLTLNVDKFERHFELPWQPYSVQNNSIFTSYNLYNLTTRPTNSFNGINFLALNKEDGSRKSFVPKNDLFIEFDFDAYHLMLIAKLIGFQFEEGRSIHTVLGEQYFETKELTEEQYSQSKAITFQQIYGGIRKEYAHIEFFKKIDEYIKETWKAYQETGKIVLQTGRPLHLHKNSLNPQKLFNYIVQNLETWQNVQILKKLNALLENKRSKIVLVVYDSFLLDYWLEDGKQPLLDIKQLIQEEGFTIKAKVGKNYDALEKTNYL